MTESDFKAKMMQLSRECIQCYYQCKDNFGSEFESMMADICGDILNLQYKGDMSFGQATLLLLDNADDKTLGYEGRECLNIGIKAAFCWHAFEFSDMEKTLRQLK